MASLSSANQTTSTSISWSRDEISSCNCDEKPFTHVHCKCWNCCGKAVHRSTEFRHWRQGFKRLEQPRRKKVILSCLQTECMDLETELLEEQKKDQHSNKDTLNEHIENEVGNIRCEVHDFRAVNTSGKDASGNGQVESPNGTSQDLSSQTGNAHDEEDAVTSHASDKFPHHNPLGVVADEHDASGNGQVESPNGTSQDLSSHTGNAHDEEDAVTSHASDKFPHHNPLRVGADEHGTLRIAIDVDSVTFKEITKELGEVKRELMFEMTKAFFETREDGIPAPNIPGQLCSYLEGVLDLPVVLVEGTCEGRVMITVEYRSLETLERLWEDHCSGHLKAVVGEWLVTDDILRSLDVQFLKLKTTILKGADEIECKSSLMDITDTRAEHTTKQEMQRSESEESLEAEAGKEATTIIEEQPNNTLNLIHDHVTPSEDSCRKAVKCPTLKSPEHLWQDNRSGELDHTAEERVVTDDIKRRSYMESIKLKTTMLDDLSCKNWSNKPNAVGNGRRIDVPDSMSPGLSSQKGNVHDDEGVIIRDSLEVRCDKHDGGYSRERRWNESHSSERVTPVGSLTQSGKYQDRGRTSREGMAITAETLLANCQQELQEKMTAATKQHTKKIDEVTGLLGRLRVSKHIRLEDFERISSEREALKQKKEELELQKDEFQRFGAQISCLFDREHQSLSYVIRTIEKLRTDVCRECNRLKAALPMYAGKTTITDTVKENQVCVVLGETGSGKSTQMTQYLYEAGFAKNGLIVCTQPRKVAATSLAAHVAEEMGGVVGQVVGCHVGGNIQASKITSILYATDHVLLNECLRDANLSKYSCIIIDEAHERSLYSDLLLGMIKKSLAQRPELRVVITSATIDPALFVAYFDQCPVLKVSGRMFPVDVIWKDGPTSNAGNYLQEAVNTARKIHQKEGPGDILVFLTSPVETERACENLGKIEPDPNLVCFPLHGKLRQEEQRRVFEEDASKRKVIFATNCAETSITIAGIRYVVDTGMVKEMTFDPKRNKRSLEVTTIHKSSAEQRKGRAGRTQAGKCYRLYSEEEYAAMEDRSRPEILRVHLGQAMLKLMELGIKNVTEFEFVESPSLESIKLALKDLELLGATANGQLTELGHRIARVPLEPRIAKLVFDGIDQGVGAEALALAAIATVSGSVFFRMGSEEEKHIADRKKVDFCHSGGDLLTLLEVYRQYLRRPKEHRNKWAFDNSLNAKSLRLADETVKELKLVLKHELNIILPNEFQHNDMTDLKLQRILVSCYAANLCVFTGHQKAGYRVVAFNHCAQLHPSSALKFLGETPQFIVFEQLLKTSRDFVINATPVEEKWFQEMMSEGTVKYDLEELKSTVLTEVALPCSRDLMALAFGGFRRRMIDEVEEKVSKYCDGSLIVLEKNEESGQVKIFVPPVHIVKALSVVGRHLEENRKLLRDEQREEYLKEDCQSSRIVWGQGGEVQELLMPHMYRTVTVGEIQDGNALIVLDYLKSFGGILKYNFKEQNGKMRLFVTFKYAEDAAMAVKGSPSNPLGIGEKVQPSQSMSDNVHAQVPQFKVKAKWSRRLGKGTGSIEFSTVEDFSRSASSLSFHSLMIKSSVVAFRVDKHREGALFMRGLHPETSAEDVKSVIEGRLPNVKVKNVFIHRKAEFHTSNETLDSQTLSFQERLHTFATGGQFSIHLRRPSPKDFDGHANLTFQDAEEAQAVVKGLNGERISNIGIVTLQPILSTFFLCSKNVFALIEDELRTVAKELDIAFDKRLVMKVKSQRKDNRVSIEIQSDCTEHFIRATTAFNVILNGDRIDCKTSKTLEILMTNQVKEVLQAIEKDTETVISQDWKNRVVRIHGREASRESAKRAINKFLDDSIASNSQLWGIQLRGPNKPRGLLKALFKRFGVDLKVLQDIPGVQKIHVEFRNHVFKIQSSDEARETINRYVEEVSENLPKESSLSPSEAGQTQVACGICLCDIDDTTDLYRLACCGHTYDKSCVIQQLKSAEFPLKCATEGCEELLVLRDLQNLLSEKERKKLAISALDEYVKKNREVVKYCPTADCDMVYRISTEGRRFTCCACLAEICTYCQVQWHNGLTCSMFKSGKQVEGRLEEWMMQDPSNRKNCPKCKTPIEKNEGCNHMTCSGCKSHMCWLCLELFQTAEQVYAHQQHCPKR